MDRPSKRRILVGAAAALAVAGGGGAIAGTQFDSPRSESAAIVNDVATQLGIEPSKLTDALKKALARRVDAAVASGRLTKEQAEALKERIESGEVPLVLGPPRGGHFAHFADLDAAAAYLGLAPAELRTQLERGKTLAQIATDRGKSVDGLVDALVADAKTRLDQAVAAGRLTEAQEQAILADLKERISDLVNGNRPPFFREHFGQHFRGGPLPWIVPASVPA